MRANEFPAAPAMRHPGANSIRPKPRKTHRRAWLVMLALSGAASVACERPTANGRDSGVLCTRDSRADLDAGPCTRDSQCPTDDYCDFTVTHCPPDAAWKPGTVVFGSIVVGFCYPERAASCAECSTSEDCGRDGFCMSSPGPSNYPSDLCTLAAPCEHGQCGEAQCAQEECPPDGGCTLVLAPHGCDVVCVCPGLTCAADGGVTVTAVAADGGEIANGDGGQ